MAPLDHRIVTYLLMVFLFVLMAAMFMVFMVLHSRRRRPLLETFDEFAGERDPSGFLQPHANSLGLRRLGCWLAVKHRDPNAVQAALALHNPRPCSWTEGMAEEAARRLFISPPISGWILVIGAALPEPADDVDECYRFLADISRKLGQVQFFSVNHALNHHAWARLDGGRVLRAYAWAGRTLWDQGTPTPAETFLHMKCFHYGESSGGNSFSAPDAAVFNSDKVHLLAARWSLDPDEIDDHFVEHEWGIVGEAPRHY